MPAHPTRKPYPPTTTGHGLLVSLFGNLADSGEGSIYEIADRAEVVGNIYHEATIADPERRTRLERKIRDMADHTALRAHPQLAWPLLPLHTPNSGRRGFAMLRKSGISLHALLGTRIPDE